jgi:hypothetical protein
MNTRIRGMNITAMAAALILCGTGGLQSHAADTNATTVAYWQLDGAVADPNSPSGFSIPDLGTNAGQGTLSGAVPNLWILGPINGNPTFSSEVPPSSLFNADNYFNAGSASWNVGADEFSGSGAEIDCDNSAYGEIFDTPSFTEEVIFKTDYTNDPSLGIIKQTLIWNHQSSAYGELQLNETSNGTNVDMGSLLFWGWNVVNFPFVRITAAQNGGQRFDDGHWHYACCRYDGVALTMDLLAVNEDGSWVESETYISAPLNPGGAGSQGPFIIGNDESGATPFDGLINQVRFSSVPLSDNQLLANVSGCNPAIVFPSSALSPTTNTVTLGSVLNLTPVNWFNTGFPQGNQIEGGPLQFQWQFDGTNISGKTNLNLDLFPASLADAGNYQLVVSSPCGGLLTTSAPITVQVSQAVNLARWSFNFTEDQTFPQATVDDSAPDFINVYDLITFNNQPNLSGIGSNGEIPLTNDVPPSSMFIGGASSETNAFNAAYLAGQDGVVFYPAGPDVFDFQGSFSLELFFRSYGDQSTNSTMELICQGTDTGETFRYGISLNQGVPGALSFKINNYAISPANAAFAYEDTNAGIQSVVLTNANYADGNWHYVLAQYDSSGNKITLNVANQNGAGTNATTTLPAGYSPLAANFEGNLFVGRMHYPWNPDGQEGTPPDDPRNFIGELGEVQVSSGLVTPSYGQLGLLAGTVVVPSITGITVRGATVTINFNGSPADAASAFTLVGSSTLNGTFSALSSTVTSIGSGSFQATIPENGSAEFYRIKR